MFLHWFLALGRDLWCVVVMVFRNLSGSIRFDRPIRLNEQSSSTPIILVHGSSGNQGEWLCAIPHIQSTFKNHPVFAFSLDLPYNVETGEQEGGDKKNSVGMKWLARQHDWTIEQYAAELGKRIDLVSLNKSVILIGHSMGGLVCAQYELEKPEKVVSLVAFSSPFRGAPLLNNRLVKFFNNSKRHRQMTPRSDFLSSLHPLVQAVGEVDPAKVDARMRRYLTIGSAHDWQVPNDCATFSTNPYVQHIQVSGYGHFSIVESKELWRQVYAFVDQYQEK